MAFRRLHHVIKHLRSTATAAFPADRRTRSGRGRGPRRAHADLAATLGCGRYGVELLEGRTLLATTISGFTDDVFEYRDELDQVIRVKATGNIVAELVGAQIDRRDNAIRLVNLPGNLNGEAVSGGLNPAVARDVIGDLFIPGGIGSIQALAAGDDGTVYAINSIVAGPIIRHQIVDLTIPLPAVLGNNPDGPVIGDILVSEIIVPSGTNEPNQPLTITAADVAPNGRIVFVGLSGDGSFGIWSVDPAAPDVGATLGYIGRLDVRRGDDDDPLPSVDALVMLGDNNAVAIVNGENGVPESQLLDINLSNPGVSPDPIPIFNDVDGALIGGIIGADIDVETGELFAIQSGPNAGVFQIFNTADRGRAFNLGPIGVNTMSSLTFVPGLLDPFSGDTRGSYVAFDPLTEQLFYIDARDRQPAQFLWNIYVSQSDLTGQLTMGYVRDLDSPPPDPYVIRAFEGSIGGIRIQPAQGGQSIVVGANDLTGRMLLGARSQNIFPNTDLEQLIPYDIADLPPEIDFGAIPDELAALRPGLIVAPGNDLGKILVGGTFMGAVDVQGGSMDFFYAGWLLTGTPSGQIEGPIEVTDNFNVTGDLRNLITLDDMGTNGAGVDTGAPQYVTGFDLRVGGTLGEVGAGSFLDPDRANAVIASGGNSSIVGSIEVNHLPNAPRIERNQFEAEFHSQNIELGFEQFNFAGSPFTFNDTYNTAEYLGSIRSGDLGRSEVIRLSGTLQKLTDPDFNDQSFQPPDPRVAPSGDNADYYAVSLMAGQRYTARVQGFPTGFLNLGVFDPDGRLVASDYNDTLPLLTQEEFFSFVPDRPGIFRFAVAANGDAPEFNGGGLQDIGAIPYTLTVLGVGDIAVGGIVADGAIFDIFDPLSYDPGIEVFVGDLGAVKSYSGRFLSENTDTIVVERGNLRAVDAENVGLGATGGGTTNTGFAPFVDVPQGNVGLVRAGPAVLQFDQDPLARIEDEVLGGTATSILIFNVGNTRPIGGSYQVIDGDEAGVLVDLIADGGIGVIRAGTMSPGASVLTVNADDRGEDGIIDLIDCFGDLGNIADGGPQITTNTGGNVRYIRCLGTVYKDIFFGRGEPDQIIISPGQELDVVDDSGAVLHMRPIGEVRRNPNFVGPRSFITPYGIRDAGGNALIDITSEGGLDVEVTGGNFAEIGRIEIRGVGVEVLNGSDVRDPDSQLGTRERFVTAEGTIRPDDDQQVDPDDPDGDPDFDAFDRRVRPEDLSLNIRGGGRVDVLNVVVIETGDDTDADEDGVFDEADEDNDGNTSELLDADGDGLPDDTGNSNEIRESDGFYLGELREDLPDLVDFGNAVNIINDTPRGEIVNLITESVVTLSARGTLGMGRNHTGADIVGNEQLHMDSTLRGVPGIGRRTREVQTNNTRDVGTFGYFLGETNAIMALGGNIDTIRAGEGIGNVAVQGSVANITANADGNDLPGVFEGINGVVSTYGFDDIDQPVETGRLLRVDIGEGILPSGTGNFAEAGVFAYNAIGRLVGNRADIRGDVQSLNGVTVVDLQTIDTERLQVIDDSGGGTVSISRPRGIESIRINDGSIINADVLVTTDRNDTEEFDLGLAIPGLSDPLDNPIFELGEVTVNGNGGIIGSTFFGPDIGRIAAGGGTFGILQTRIAGLADDRVNSVEASGYGLRALDIIPSGSMGSLIANGDGTNLSTNAISSSVRFSEQAIFDPLVGVVDPFFGTQPNRLTDIHAFLGTNKDQPEISGVTDTGIIEATSAVGSRDLGTVRAWQIRGGTNLDFANRIRNLEVRDIINGLEITTGSIKSFRLDRDAFALGINVSGRVRKIDIRGSLAGGSVIRTKGDAGRFDSINVSGNLIGNINSARAIKNITIGGDFTGNVSVNAADRGLGIKSMKVGGTFIAGSLDVIGGIGTITSAGSLGALGDTLTVNGSVKKITVGGDLRSNLRVTGDLKSLLVRGSIVDGGLPNGLLIDVSDTLNSLVVGGDIQSGVTINASRIGKQKVGGQNAGTTLALLAARLKSEGVTVTKLAFSHSAPLDGMSALQAFEASK